MVRLALTGYLDSFPGGDPVVEEFVVTLRSALSCAALNGAQR
jgi:hypothetical protein